MIRHKYILAGFYIITFWGGGTGWKRVIIETNIDGLMKIKKDPLQDYISFGVESVDYVEFDVYRKTITEKEDKRITVEEKEPYEHIEAGIYNLLKREDELLGEDYDVAEVNY